MLGNRRSAAILQFYLLQAQCVASRLDVLSCPRVADSIHRGIEARFGRFHGHRMNPFFRHGNSSSVTKTWDRRAVQTDLEQQSARGRAHSKTLRAVRKPREGAAAS